jgi:hypothetical protein
MADSYGRVFKTDGSDRLYVVPTGADTTLDLVKVSEEWSYLHVTAAATTSVKLTPGVLGKVVVNTGDAGTLKVYDALAADVGAANMIAEITVTATIIGSYAYNLVFGTALTIVGSADTDYTVCYR